MVQAFVHNWLIQLQLCPGATIALTRLVKGHLMRYLFLSVNRSKANIAWGPVQWEAHNGYGKLVNIQNGRHDMLLSYLVCIFEVSLHDVKVQLIFNCMSFSCNNTHTDKMTESQTTQTVLRQHGVCKCNTAFEQNFNPYQAHYCLKVILNLKLELKVMWSLITSVVCRNLHCQNEFGQSELTYPRYKVLLSHTFKRTVLTSAYRLTL